MTAEIIEFSVCAKTLSMMEQM